MSRKFGFELLAEQIGDNARAEAEALCATVSQDTGTSSQYGDSPIEKLLFAAVFLFTWTGGGYHRLEPFEEGSGDLLTVQRQAEIEGVGRVDYLFRRASPDKDTRLLIVECDGHEFHERTKEQVAKDRARDRAAALLDYQIFRFTGAELWGDPLGCARQVIQWADGGNPR